MVVHDGWFREEMLPGARRRTTEHGFRIERLVFEGHTALQHVLVFDHALYGRVLVLDGVVQLSTLDQATYHEMLVHPALASHGAPRRILVIGGGDGATLRECLLHDPEEVVLVDLDPEVIAICREHLPELSQGAFDDPRVRLVHEDGARFVARAHAAYDAILVDGGDYVGPSAVLCDPSFFAAIARALRPGGVMAIQMGSALDRERIRGGRRDLRSVFADVTSYRLTLASYHCGEYCFLAASHAPIVSTPDPARLLAAERALQRHRPPSHWTPAVHRAAQILPPHFP